MSLGREKRRFGSRGIAATFLMPLCIATALAKPTPQEQDVPPDGARIFVERCVLCHGNYGAGDGIMPLVITDYPETNLLRTKKSGHFSELQRQIMWGGAKGHMNQKSPPWVDELKLSEMEAVAQFLVTLQGNPEQARYLLDRYLANKPISVETGRLVYQTRCESCHGSLGRGDGPLSAIVNTPPPANLVESRLSDLDMGRIISLGGAKVGRSRQMPPWKYELTQVQIDSVAAYIQQLRK